MKVVSKNDSHSKCSNTRRGLRKKKLFQGKETRMATSFFLFSSRRQLFVVVVWNFELYMLPLALLLLLVWNFMFSSGRETNEMVRKVGNISLSLK